MILMRKITKREFVKLVSLAGITIACSRYFLPYSHSAESVGGNTEQAKFETVKERNDISHIKPVTSSKRSIDELIQEFVIDRHRRTRPASQFVLYTRDNTPGFFKRRNWHWTLTRRGEYSPDVYTVPSDEVPEQRLPSAYVLGVSHSGSVALFEYMKLHPNIATVFPEVRYFDLEENLPRGMDWYKAQMPLSFSDQITVETNPSYFWDHRVPRKIYKINKGVKLIVVLRDPVQRIMSLMTSQDIPKTELTTTVQGVKTVNDQLWVVASGVYLKFINQWLAFFPLSQLHFIEYEDLMMSPVQTMVGLEEFLNIPKKITSRNFNYNATLKHHCLQPFHVSGLVCPKDVERLATLPPSEERIMYEFYKEYNERLFTLIGRRFVWEPSHSIYG